MVGDRRGAARALRRAPRLSSVVCCKDMSALERGLVMMIESTAWEVMAEPALSPPRKPALSLLSKRDRS